MDLLPDERAELVGILRSLTDEQWARPTVCAGWSVKDVAQHLLGDDLGRLSGGRDGWPGTFQPTGTASFEAELLAYVNERNQAWVEATRRLSPSVIISLLAWTGHETQAYFESLDPYQTGLGVSWAGEDRSPNWFDLAREYTERWHHQAQIREGAGLPLLDEPRLFAPVLATLVRGLPHAFRNAEAPEGTRVSLIIEGDAGGAWLLVKTEGSWRLERAAGEEDAAATVTIGQDAAWRLFTKGLSDTEALARSDLNGDPRLARQVLKTVSIIA